MDYCLAGGCWGSGYVVLPTETMIRPQQLLALERANAIRRRRSELKRRIGAGELSAAEVILNFPAEASTWPVAELLTSQRNWGSAKSRNFLSRNGISELKSIGELTERQRHLLAEELSPRARPASEVSNQAGQIGPAATDRGRNVASRTVARKSGDA